MSRIQRIQSIGTGLFMLIAVLIICFMSTNGPELILIILAVSLILQGLRSLILRAREERKYKASSWKRNAAYGAVSMLIAISCFILNNRPAELSVLYCVGLGYSGVMKIVDGFRRTEIVYIQ